MQNFKVWRGPYDLVFDPTWPSFKFDLDIIRINFLTKIHELVYIQEGHRGPKPLTWVACEARILSYSSYFTDVGIKNDKGNVES